MRIFVWGLLLSITFTGCSPSSKTVSSSADTTQPTLDTLELNPANPIVIAGWWSNGRYLLEVEYDFAYRIRQGHYPNSPVIEHGRWTRENHAAFELEPYNVGPVAPERAALSLEKGVPVATIHGLAPFRKLPSPPRLLVDQLTGTWRGRPGTLVLEREGAFVLQRTGEPDPIKGTWGLERGSLILKPTPSTADPEVLSLRKTRRGEVDAILGLDGALTRGRTSSNPV